MLGEETEETAPLRVIKDVTVGIEKALVLCEREGEEAVTIVIEREDDSGAANGFEDDNFADEEDGWDGIVLVGLSGVALGWVNEISLLGSGGGDIFRHCVRRYCCAARPQLKPRQLFISSRLFSFAQTQLKSTGSSKQESASANSSAHCWKQSGPCAPTSPANDIKITARYGASILDAFSPRGRTRWELQVYT